MSCLSYYSVVKEQCFLKCYAISVCQYHGFSDFDMTTLVNEWKSKLLLAFPKNHQNNFTKSQHQIYRFINSQLNFLYKRNKCF